MSEILAQMSAEFAELTQQIKGMRSDITSLQREQEALKQEFREEIAALRRDLALTSSKQNSEIDANKKKSTGSLKKLTGSLPVPAASMGD